MALFSIQAFRQLFWTVGSLVVCLAGTSCGSGEPDRDRDQDQKPAGVFREGQPAPALKFTLADGTSKRLADYQGKVVLLEFWASWCVNCKVTMDELQEVRGEHPGWGDQVEILAVSIDDDQDAAAKALGSRGWTKTSTAWADPAGGKNSQLAVFVGKGIPAACVIDADGVVRRIGHPGRTDHAGVIDRILAKVPAVSP